MDPGRSGRHQTAPPSDAAGAGGWMARLFGRRGGASPHGRSPTVPAAAFEAAALEAALEGAVTQSGESLLSLSAGRPRLVVLLRHLGCTFCRETLAELARSRQSIEARGAGIVLVHLARDDQRAQRLFEIYRLADLPRIADPERRLYLALGLDHGSVGDLIGPHVLVRAVEATCRGHLPGRSGGDTRQMPGVLLIHRGRTLAEFRHRNVADRPDYLALVDRLAESGTA